MPDIQCLRKRSRAVHHCNDRVKDYRTIFTNELIAFRMQTPLNNTLISRNPVPTGLVRQCRASRISTNDMLQQVLERSRPRATFRTSLSSRLEHNLERG